MENAPNERKLEERGVFKALRSKLRGRRGLAMVLICILTVSGLYLSYRVYLRKNFVGIIRIEGYIEETWTVDGYIDMINQAIVNDSVKAVVLVIDSGGGYANYIEQIYLDLLELKKRKPLVASIVYALSGGYYIAVAADYIYVQPSSPVGLIGVIGYMPSILIPSEQVVETGPYKWTAFPILYRFHQLNQALDQFVSAVETGRGKRLKLPPTQLKRAMAYYGYEAVDVGLADEIGSLQKAVKKAAEEAGLVRYEVVELRPQKSNSQMSSWGFPSNASAGWGELTLEALKKLHPPPAIHYIYLPSEAITSSPPSREPLNATIETVASGGRVLIDLSHGNQVSWWDLDILIQELAKRNVTVSTVSEWEELNSKLGNASCLIVASPTETYSIEECNRIEKFVEEGGMLLLFFDPAWEYIGKNGLLHGIIAPINSLSIKFGLSFAKGYLYNEEKYFGIYRNIYVRSFASNPLTQNLTSIVLFTATHIHSMDKGVAWTSNNTYRSVAEKTDNYTPIVWVKRGDGTVIAFGDLTFLREPYCYVDDNYKLILNLVSLITAVKPPVERVEKGVKEEITEPDLPVGTVKEFTETINRDEHLLKWIKVSEKEVVVERPNTTSHYYYDEEGSLIRQTSNGMEIVYDTPIPAPPYPLTLGKSWSVESEYTLYMDKEKSRGKIAGEYRVQSFQDVEAGNGKTYFSAKVFYKVVDEFKISDRNITTMVEGYLWISSEAGRVKEECTVKYYVDGTLFREIEMKLLLKSIRKG